MSSSRLLTALALLTLTAVSMVHFPGVTWLQSDTQIYVPIIEHLDDPTVLAKDPVAIHPHVSWSVYDETVILARRWFGLEFLTTLRVLQFLTRLAGITGVFLIARSLALGIWPSLFVAGCFALGAVINGPAVLTFEYEPVPRGFAVQLIFGALGLAAHNRWGLAGLTGVVAMLLHPPTTAPFWGCLLLFWAFSPDRRRLKTALFALVSGIGFATLLRMLQHGERERQVIFGRIDPFLEQVQRFRGAYNWIELWPSDWFWQYPLLLALCIAAWLRLRKDMNGGLRWFSIALPVVGMFTMPLQWLLLDQLKWIFMPQFQPARAVLFITALCVIMGASAGWKAAAAGRWLEAGAWLFVVYAVPLNGLVVPLITKSLSDPLCRKRLWLAIALCGLSAACAFLSTRVRPLAAAAIAAPLVLIPTLGKVHNSPDLHTPEIRELSQWAKRTPKDAVFLFADAARSLAPGIFRAEARRNLYVDWKSGGQANLLRSFARDWQLRWFEHTNQCHPPLKGARYYRDLGVDYLVLESGTSYENRPAAYSNARYRVFDLSE